MPLVRRSFRVGALGCTCTIVACPETGEGIVIDPGDEAERILEELRALGVTAVSIVHTHAHFDHVLGAPALAAATKADVALHREDLWLHEQVPVQLQLFGFAPAAAPAAPRRLLDGGEVLPFGRREARVLHTPGHTPGSVCVYVEGAGERPILFSGDTLFSGSIGRTDLWGGDHGQIVESIRGPLFDLPDDTLVVPGHGPETSIGFEREDNPFVGRSAGI
jgi:glyoxylase-like metal-dependent hydrolase (beta-lactamase superfamily II)